MSCSFRRVSANFITATTNKFSVFKDMLAGIMFVYFYFSFSHHSRIDLTLDQIVSSTLEFGGDIRRQSSAFDTDRALSRRHPISGSGLSSSVRLFTMGFFSCAAGTLLDGGHLLFLTLQPTPRCPRAFHSFSSSCLNYLLIKLRDRPDPFSKDNNVELGLSTVRLRSGVTVRVRWKEEG